MIRQVIGLMACVVFATVAVANANGLNDRDEAQGPTTPITITTAKATNLEVWESSVGQLESTDRPHDRR